MASVAEIQFFFFVFVFFQLLASEAKDKFCEERVESCSTQQYYDDIIMNASPQVDWLRVRF